jgi:nicotinic acid mononucleotide adenylyltransferase
MAEAWPLDVNQNMEPSSYQEQTEDGVASFEPEVGPPTRRRRSAIAMAVMSYTTVMGRDELESFKRWYRDTLASGVKSFTRKHPQTREPNKTFMFTAVPKWSGISNSKYRLTLAMRELP